MEISSSEARQALHYLSSVHRHGYSPTPAELDAYAGGPTPRFTPAPGRGMMRWTSDFEEFQRSDDLRTGRASIESFSTYLLRLGWAAVVPEKRLSITALGSAVLGAMNDEAALDIQMVVARAIDPDDPFAYAKVIGEIAGSDDAMVVDPYLKSDGLQDLLRLPSVSRVLTSDESRPGKTKPSPKIAVFEHMVEASVVTGFELRTLPLTQMHDRYVIPKTGSVLNLTTSFNSIGQRIGVAVWLPELPSAAIRDAHAALWDAGTKVARQQAPGPVSDPARRCRDYSTRLSRPASASTSASPL
jgi:hypothetical protein